MRRCVAQAENASEMAKKVTTHLQACNFVNHHFARSGWESGPNPGRSWRRTTARSPAHKSCRTTAAKPTCRWTCVETQSTARALSGHARRADFGRTAAARALSTPRPDITPRAPRPYVGVRWRPDGARARCASRSRARRKSRACADAARTDARVRTPSARARRVLDTGSAYLQEVHRVNNANGGKLSRITSTR